jgi:hypothetical protein
MVEDVNKVEYWGQEVYRGKHIVVGKYYKRQGCNSQSFVLCDGGLTFIYSHLVIVTKFNMIVAQHKQGCGISGSKVYTLPIEAFNHI